MKFAAKIGSFLFCKVIKKTNKELKNEKNLKMVIVKICLGISLELLRTVWGQVNFRQFLVPTYTSSQGLQAPSNAQSMLTTGF